jgi:hypothetical protein
MINKLILSLALFAGSAAALPVFTLNPVNGQISGTPGSTVGWGFTLTPDSTFWVSVTSSILLTESNPSLGTYTDFIGALGGPVNFATPPAGGNWVLAFNNAASEGVGSFTISAAANPGDQNTGTLRISVEYFSDDPFTCGSCAEGSDDFDLAYSITVAPVQTQVPEPATWAAGGIALAVVALRRGREHR